jgi:uncharacterized membrane protein
VEQGASGTSTITAAISGGFDSAITLATAEGQAITFSPNPIAAPGSGTSTMTVKVPSTYKAGTYALKVTATGGGLTETTKVTVTVTAK